MVMSLKAESRETGTVSDKKKMRAAGKIPAVVYGKKIAGGASLFVEQKELLSLLRANPHAIIELDIPNAGKQPVMITDIQRNSLTRQLLHVDFHQINMDEPVRTVVTLEYTGDAVGVKEGGILQVQKHDIDIRCLPQYIPASIQVDVSHLAIGDSLLVSQLAVPPNIEVKSDASDLLVTVLVPQKESPKETEATEAAEAKRESKGEAETPAREEAAENV